MPLTEKGEKILKNMQSEYGEKRGKSVFYASANSGKITGVHDSKDGDPQREYLDAARRGDSAGMTRAGKRMRS